MKKILYISLLLATSCMPATIEKLKKVGQAPEFEKMEMPMQKSDYKPINWSGNNDQVKQTNYNHSQEATLKPKHANSLWQPGARTFFRDQRARRVGDILKVSININDTANWSNKTQQTRTTKESSSAPNIFGLEGKLKNVIKGIDPTNLFTAAGNDDLGGKGTISRNEAVQTEVSAMVTQILPNGNLVIQAHQEVRVNFELREITVEGIVRPEDITSDNLVTSDQIAEARISYGGRGNITNLQQPRWGNQVMDIINPF
ncbi:MAG: flagellar basal body L-ring protein FlgH [Alphaproteobacteria bacterium]